MNQRALMFSRVAFVATLLALFVILLGAYTRLQDAGLGCPDWPGCYGQLLVPKTHLQLHKAAVLFPGQQVVAAKAWPEMIHRYFAGTLGLLIFGLSLFAFWRRKHYPLQTLSVPVLLILGVLFQAALGMWTVTWKLLPLVVMGHLLGGMTLASLLWVLTLNSDDRFRPRVLLPHSLRPWAVLGLIIVSLQIFLGGWTSSNYAALVCVDVPTCHGQWFPHMDFTQAFNFFRTIGVNYEGGVLSTAARVAIQMTHRYGAFVTATYVGLLSLYLISARKTIVLRPLGWLILLMLGMQMTFGVLNVLTLLHLPIALAHNGVAVLLLLSLVTLVFKLYATPVSHSSH